MSVLLPYSDSRGRLLGVGLGNVLRVIKSLFKASSVRVQRKKKNAEVLIAAHILKQYCQVTFSFFHFRGLLSPFSVFLELKFIFIKISGQVNLF